MSDNLLTKANFKNQVLNKLRDHYPQSITISEEEFGCDISAPPFNNMKPNDPEVRRAHDNAELLHQAIEELTSARLITSKKSGMTFWGIKLTEFGYIQTKNMT